MLVLVERDVTHLRTTEAHMHGTQKKCYSHTMLLTSIIKKKEVGDSWLNSASLYDVHQMLFIEKTTQLALAMLKCIISSEWNVNFTLPRKVEYLESLVNDKD